MTPENFPGDILSVLLGEENAPARAEGRRDFCAKQTADARIAVGFMPAGDFVVGVVLEAGHAAKLRIESCGFVAALCKNANGLVCRVAVIGVQVKQESGV